MAFVALVAVVFVVVGGGGRVVDVGCVGVGSGGFGVVVDDIVVAVVVVVVVVVVGDDDDGCGSGCGGDGHDGRGGCGRISGGYCSGVVGSVGAVSYTHLTLPTICSV